MSQYNTHTTVIVFNNMGATAAIRLEYKYSTDPLSAHTWEDVPDGQSGQPPFRVGYNTGFIRFGASWWRVVVTVQGGSNAGTWVSNNGSWKQCTLRNEDADQALPFTVSPGRFVMTMPSGTCSTRLRRVSDTFNLADLPAEPSEPAMPPDYGKTPIQD